MYISNEINKNFDNPSQLRKIENLKNSYNNSLNNLDRWKNPKNASGRFEIWSDSFKIIKHNFFFGLGPQTDRHKLDISASNILIYLFLCGGLLTVLVFFIYKTYLTLIFFYFFKKKKYLQNYKRQIIIFFNFNLFIYELSRYCRK